VLDEQVTGMYAVHYLIRQEIFVNNEYDTLELNTWRSFMMAGIYEKLSHTKPEIK
jgi:hypothetical protein